MVLNIATSLSHNSPSSIGDSDETLSEGFTQKEEDQKIDFYQSELVLRKLEKILPQGVMIFGGVVGGCALSFLARRAFSFLAAGKLAATAGVIAINSLGGVAGGEVALAGLSLFLYDYASIWQRYKRGNNDVDTVEELVGAYAYQWLWSTFQSGAIGMAGRGVNIGAKMLVASGGNKAVVGRGLQVIGSKLDWTEGQANTLAQLGYQIPGEYLEEVGDTVVSRIWAPLEYVLGAARGGKVGGGESSNLTGGEHERGGVHGDKVALRAILARHLGMIIPDEALLDQPDQAGQPGAFVVAGLDEEQFSLLAERDGVTPVIEKGEVIYYEMLLDGKAVMLVPLGSEMFDAYEDRARNRGFFEELEMRRILATPPEDRTPEEQAEVDFCHRSAGAAWSVDLHDAVGGKSDVFRLRSQAIGNDVEIAHQAISGLINRVSNPTTSAEEVGLSVGALFLVMCQHPNRITSQVYLSLARGGMHPNTEVAQFCLALLTTIGISVEIGIDPSFQEVIGVLEEGLFHPGHTVSRPYFQRALTMIASKCNQKIGLKAAHVLGRGMGDPDPDMARECMDALQQIILTSPPISSPIVFYVIDQMVEGLISQHEEVVDACENFLIFFILLPTDDLIPIRMSISTRMCALDYLFGLFNQCTSVNTSFPKFFMYLVLFGPDDRITSAMQLLQNGLRSDNTSYVRACALSLSEIAHYSRRRNLIDNSILEAFRDAALKDPEVTRLYEKLKEYQEGPPEPVPDYWTLNQNLSRYYEISRLLTPQTDESSFSIPIRPMPSLLCYQGELSNTQKHLIGYFDRVFVARDRLSHDEWRGIPEAMFGNLPKEVNDRRQIRVAVVGYGTTVGLIEELLNTGVTVIAVEQFNSSAVLNERQLRTFFPSAGDQLVFLDGSLPLCYPNRDLHLVIAVTPDRMALSTSFSLLANFGIEGSRIVLQSPFIAEDLLIKGYVRNRAPLGDDGYHVSPLGEWPLSFPIFETIFDASTTIWAAQLRSRVPKP